MQVRVLRQYPDGSSDIRALWPENQHREAVVVRSGTPIQAILESVANAPALVVRCEAEGDEPSWLPGPRARFAEWIDELESGGHNVSLCLWPTAAGPVSDSPSLQTFLRTAAERGHPWKFLFDPISMLTPAMLPGAEDHLARLFETFLDHPASWGCLLADAAVVDGRVLPAPLGKGPLTELVVRLAKGVAKPVFMEQGAAEQARLLGLTP